MFQEVYPSNTGAFRVFRPMTSCFDGAGCPKISQVTFVIPTGFPYNPEVHFNAATSPHSYAERLTIK